MVAEKGQRTYPELMRLAAQPTKSAIEPGSVQSLNAVHPCPQRGQKQPSIIKLVNDSFTPPLVDAFVAIEGTLQQYEMALTP